MSTTRVHLYRPIFDSAGNLRQGAVVRLLDPDTNLPIDQLIRPNGDLTDDTHLANPFTVATGVIDIYLDEPQILRIGITPAGGNQETIIDNVYPDGVSAALALRSTDAVIVYTDTQPLRNTVTTDLQRRVRWVSPTAPVVGSGYAIAGLDVWERVPS